MENIQEDIKTARERKNFTQTDMANKLGIGLRMYQKIEKGEFPKYKTEQIKRVDELLNTNFYELIYEQKVCLNNIEDDKLSDRLPVKFTASSYKQKMEDALYNLTVSNSNLAIAFVKQASAQEKDADARIIQATANKILVEVNKETLSKIPDPITATEKYTQESQLMTRTLEMMAKTLVRQGIYQSDEEATLYLGKLLTSEEEEEIFLNKKTKRDTQNKHKA